ncbi:DUF4118 domain-containing protein [Alicyclobacillus tolerans]|uniref:ATP-binding protein n=1 Tax=Alicyclobacillus tolerans TaxID=90970 RepID=UPI001F2A1AE2|nr:ATP-binding protein [Alicyclobacillus tolerans]MCF8567602.1 DUF4118 domain-containing protein [Alicyclobacillus tolerans]
MKQRLAKQTRSFRPKWRVISSHVVPWPRAGIRLNQTSANGTRFTPYVLSSLMVAGLTVLFWEVGYLFTLVNIALLYLLPVLVTATRWGLWPSFYAAGISVIAFDLFFVPPLFTFTVGDARYLISFAVYLAVAAFTAGLAAQLRQRFKEAHEREAVTSALYTLSTQVAAARDLDTVLQEIVQHAHATLGLSAAIVLPDPAGNLKVRARQGFNPEYDAKAAGSDAIAEPRILRWVYEHGKMAGYGTNSHRDTSLLYVPLKTESKIHGVMCIETEHASPIGVANNRLRVVQALAGLAAVSVARVHFEEEAKIAHLTAESERLRTALLDSISHELRTPLATILGAVTGMTESADLLSAEDQRELLATIREGAMRMNRLVTNLLGMVRLESGMLRLNKHWCDVSDIVGVALTKVQDSLQNRSVNVNLQNHLPPIAVDDVLIEQVLVNLLSNAVKYSPEPSPIHLDVLEYDGVLTIRVRDFGIGIRPGETEKVFDKFYRSDATKKIPGTGLGLAICKGIVQAHGGEIFASNAPGGGAVFTIRLPVGDTNRFDEG